jgi:hypothetical protein
MKLPDYPDSLASEQSRSDGLEQCRMSHRAAHLVTRGFWTEGKANPYLSRSRFRKGMVPRVGFEPTTYRLRSGCSTAELPGRRDQEARAAAVAAGVLPFSRAAAKPVHAVNPPSTQ